ncbi:MAG: AMMECR1 domain-containing protein, partial [Patescibacteria group bacterium]|nr:AMMECR1 domain-containing protein [Patescibacteria group bacterium]
IEVSVLSVPEVINDPEIIEMGKHGVILEKGLRRGVFLPQVAIEQGYNREQFLAALCTHKMNLASDCWRDKNIEIKIFTADIFHE